MYFLNNICGARISEDNSTNSMISVFRKCKCLNFDSDKIKGDTLFNYSLGTPKSCIYIYIYESTKYWCSRSLQYFINSNN